MARKAQAKPSGDVRKREVGRLEWAVGGLGFLITLAIFGVLGYEAATFEDGPPVLVARVVDVVHNDAGWVARFEVENRGVSTAAEVVVRATLKSGDAVSDEAEATLDYVARKSRREGGMILKHDPASGTLELAAVSYRNP